MVAINEIERNVTSTINDQIIYINNLANRLDQIAENKIEKSIYRVNLSINTLDKLNPSRLLMSGYSVVTNKNKVINDENTQIGSSQEIENNQKMFASLRTQRDSLQNEITELKIKKTTLDSELNSIQAEIDRLDASIKQYDFILVDVKSNLERVSSLIASKNSSIFLSSFFNYKFSCKPRIYRRLPFHQRLSAHSCRLFAVLLLLKAHGYWLRI